MILSNSLAGVDAVVVAGGFIKMTGESVHHWLARNRAQRARVLTQLGAPLVYTHARVPRDAHARATYSLGRALAYV